MKRMLPMVVATLALGLLCGLPASAQNQPGPGQPLDPSIKETFVQLGRGVPAMLYEPVKPGPKSQIALFVMHADGDYLRFSACTELSLRGYRVLCANNTSDKAGQWNDGILDKALLQTKLGIDYLRQLPGVKKVVLFGHSGGATIMTAYQAIAEQGVKFCQGPDKVLDCPNTLAGLTVPDGIVLADANWGQAQMVLVSIDPSVVDEATGMKQNPDLDMYNPKNGFVPGGSHFTPQFVHNFLAAEGQRNNELIRRAQQRLALIEAGQGLYADDEPFIVPGAIFTNNKLFSQDSSLLTHSLKPWPLIHADGSVTTGIIHSVRTVEGGQNPVKFMMRGALKTTVRNFLSSYAVRVTADYGYDDAALHGIEWRSSYASPPGNAEGITRPFLALGMTGHWEGLAAEEIYNHAQSADKSLAFVEGADHMYQTCKSCEKTPGQFGDTVKTTYNAIDGWLAKPGRFLVAAQ